MDIVFTPATLTDIPDILAFRVKVAEDMTFKFGKGLWSSAGTEKGIFYVMEFSTIYIARINNNIVASVTLSARKPWAIDRKYFTKCKRPMYLTSMAVEPAWQRRGIGRICIDNIIKAAKELTAGAICLDAFDAESGAGDFYRKCGFKEVGRAAYRSCPLIYFEMMI